MIESILIVCEGNLCRSPMAAALFAATLPGRAVTSAGLNALVGLPAAPLAQDVMRERGVDLSAHRAQQLGRAHCASADLILVMDRGQRRLVEERYPLARGKVFRIGEHENFDVHDPYRQPRFVFERSARLLELGVNGWLSRLRLV
ncbi:low molecular weight protein-tyrosine-phosphatase [Burkholderia pseudomallei]|uniref:low molecular weight protein-tyrosine-phosphatase n=1 Tax=Burkholderia pseudomallei TaxID=28450 RepID=UPI000978687C|nr:low molecular weight protein-tyrosine-phosphatase [Burkholderia pseudomallei]MBM5578773.1 low molecular weight phosphotyrosine protein phosphatase [Burkholderia pseudomallei]MBM5586669.1 low molecular weight phosphotyrosine protein phosphatase [Burkholderia pseudomallei]ONC95599.1 protein tyrosine phosphatase [Burkholderia pseudomallei]OND02282.1 protein tyrosine phosphatase [Burkholderia pseudomallei]OND12629.1 protein tyrosine phosphatase [Burkholderia pseudomallei]